MERVGSTKLWSFLDGSVAATETTNGKVRTDAGREVQSYLELAARVAELQYRNRNHVLFFRGQLQDWKSAKGFTTLEPTIFRPQAGKSKLSSSEIQSRYDKLLKAEELLSEGFSFLKKLGRQRVARERLLRWSIFQHYEVCATPLLDVTHSLRITANAEGGLQVIRLASVCPPAAIRPHIQEGYLLGEYPEMIGITQQKHYKPYEMDFGRRVIAKFRFNPASFWRGRNFPQISKTVRVLI